MNPRTNPTRRALAAALLGSALAALAPAAASQTFKLVEDFEDLATPGPGEQGPQALVDRGWTFRNQSTPLGSAAFWPGSSPWWPYSGNGFLRASSTAAGMFGATVSSWAVLPEVPGQAAGDLLTIQALDGGYPSADTFLEVRYSPSGGTSTGSGPFDVGDFSDVLFSGELSLAAQFVYSQVAVVLPGPGRVALRFHVPSISNFMSSASLALDALTVGGAQPPPCGLALPESGGEVVWDAAGSPYFVCQDLVVPSGATLVLDAGTTVEFASQTNLIVEGRLLARGTDGSPVTLLGDNVSGLRVEGEALLEFAEVRAAISSYRYASVEAYDSVFDQVAWFSTLQVPAFTRLVRCELASEVVELTGSTVLDGVVVTEPSSYVALGGFWRIAGLDSVAPLLFRSNLQERAVDHVTVTGVAGPALELHATAGAGDFFLGPDNVLSGNDYPVWTRFAGLTPDSTVPASGNVNDAILGFQHLRADLRTRPSLPNLGLPYHFLEPGTAAGDVRIAPGAVLRFGPLASLAVTADGSTDPILRGLPGQPIRFERLFPDQEWFAFGTLFGLTIFEHLEVDGAGVGVVSNGELLLRDCTITNCSTGAHPAGDGHIFGSGVEFYRNQIGLENDTTHLASAIGTGIHFSGTERPNVFVGNVLAANNVPTTNGYHHEFPADGNWWGHTTGPFEPIVHPQGQGDPVSWVDFQPFLTGAPDLSDERPVVRLVTRLHPSVLPGEKIFVEWEAFDDGTIVEFDVQMLTDDVNAPYQTYVDLVSDLPGTARRCEIVVPDVGLHPYERFPFRIVATDDAGNVGFEQFELTIPHQLPAASVTFRTPLSGLEGGEDVTVCYDALGFSASLQTLYVETAADDRLARAASATAGTNECRTVRIPFASTDRARLAIRAVDNWNRDEWYFSDYFEIRPDPRIGDAPPEVEMTEPVAGQSFAGGGVLPIRWTASDDQGLREFRIQASFNGGRSFHTIATSLPPTARSFDWQLPASTGVDDLRVRVVAVDTLLQNTSAGDDRIVTVHARPSFHSRATGTGMQQRSSR